MRLHIYSIYKHIFVYIYIQYIYKVYKVYKAGGGGNSVVLCALLCCGLCG